MNAKIILLVLLNQNCLVNAAHKKLICEAHAVLTKINKVRGSGKVGGYLSGDTYYQAESIAHEVKYPVRPEELESAINILMSLDEEISKNLEELDNKVAEYHRSSEEIASVRALMLVESTKIRKLLGGVSLGLRDK